MSTRTSGHVSARELHDCCERLAAGDDVGALFEPPDDDGREGLERELDETCADLSDDDLELLALFARRLRRGRHVSLGSDERDAPRGRRP